MKAILALCLALFLVAIHAAVLPKKSLQLKMYKPSKKAVKTRPRTYFNNRHVLAKGNATLAVYESQYFLVNVTLGTPAQTISVILNTNSAVLSVYACDDYSSTNCFNRNLSSTYSFKGNDSYDEIYGQDVFSLAGLIANSQVFELYNIIPNSYALDAAGDLGVAWPRLAPNNYTPPIQNLLSQFDKPVFSTWVYRYYLQDSNSEGGLLTLGAVDTQNCDSNVHYVPLSSLSFWQFSLSAFSVGSYTKTKTVQAIVDINLLFLAAPSDALNAIVSTLNAVYYANYDLYALPCNATGLPDLKFTIKNQIFSVSQSEYISNANFGDGMCIFEMYNATDIGFGPTWVLGQPFMRSYCNVFDVGNKMIGFAKAF